MEVYDCTNNRYDYVSSDSYDELCEDNHIVAIGEFDFYFETLRNDEETITAIYNALLKLNNTIFASVKA